jgi:hypothetical protein
MMVLLVTVLRYAGFHHDKVRCSLYWLLSIVVWPTLRLCSMVVTKGDFIGTPQLSLVSSKEVGHDHKSSNIYLLVSRPEGKQRVD